jgi:hypothetical protein
MKKWKISSKTFGTQYILLDDIDYEGMKLLGGKWSLGGKRGRFYAQKRFNGQLIEMHRYFMQPKKGEYVDHINRNTLDNQRKNLRICSNSANLRNGRIRSNNSSGITGVRWEKSRNKWVAKMKVFYKDVFLGRYVTLKDAINARKQAEKKYWNS